MNKTMFITQIKQRSLYLILRILLNNPKVGFPTSACQILQYSLIEIAMPPTYIHTVLVERDVVVGRDVVVSREFVVLRDVVVG